MMTTEQIAALTPAELRIEIARRLGWKDIHEGIGEAIGEPIGLSPVDGATYCTRLPDYPHDIGAAWKLFISMTGRPFIYKNSQGVWHVGNTLDPDQASSIIVERESEIPAAMARAWLMWKDAAHE